ncbi:MAG: ribosome recycling factor [Chloroflexi bacterium]|nr:ribosome recycling factor [Chloroflexota bacterium]|tara:strand:+ start:678 stop:1241 length:564 start_codon:yes stop_codon:yes gene_type:complete
MTEIADILRDAQRRMNQSVEVLKQDLSTYRTGRASVSLVENISVDYHGSAMPLQQLATINMPEARLLVIQPWDKSILPEIEKVLIQSDFGASPNNDGNVIRINLPAPSEERRNELIKTLNKRVEDGRLAVRNVRRDANEKIKSSEKQKSISQDESHRAQSEIQKVTDLIISEIDKIGESKENEMLEV